VYVPTDKAEVVVPDPIATLATAVAAALLVAVAVISTGPAAPGAVYVVVAPLAVWAGLKLPHVFAGVQVQSTPPFAASLITVALIVAVPPACTFAGGAAVSEIATAPEAAVTVTLDTAVLAWLVVDVAVIVALAAPVGAVNVVVAPLAV
jgi:hypothetical protein